jgi:hypothetical protein
MPQEFSLLGFGADVAALIAQAFVAAVVGRRREIEAAGATQRVLN